MDDARFPESDDDLFPLCGPGAAGWLHVDEYGVVYVCDEVPGLGWVWVSLGPAVPRPGPG